LFSLIEYIENEKWEECLMSTKIFNGYKLPQMTLKELDLFIKEARQKMNEAHYTLGEIMLVERAVQLLDMYCLFGEDYVKEMLGDNDSFKDSSAPYLSAYFELCSKSMKSEKSDRRIDSMFDFKSSICLFPIRGKILALLFTQQQAFTSTWNSIEGVEEYCYWNNTDRPKEISRYQWDRRREDWETALPGIGIPSENGFIVEFTEGFPLLFEMKWAENAHKYIDSLDARANSYAKNIVFREKLEEVTKNSGKEDSMKYYMEVGKWIKSDEGQNAITLKTEELKKILIPEITVDMLKTKFKDIKK
jgi:hypothetical protein